jgi:GNAT superfamily N-acetyltransferase
MAIVYRPAGGTDLIPAAAVVLQALNDLMARHGFESVAGPFGTDFLAYSLEDDAAGLWVADDGGRVVGLGFSWMSDGFWFLADLFVLPEYQGKGVGGELLRRALEHARSNEATNRALITFAYNRTSIGAYARQGLFPREPLYKVSAPSVALKVSPARGLACTAIDGSADHLSALAGVDQACLGFTREKHHRYLGASPAVRGFLLEDGGNHAGYAYLSSDGHIGPLAVTSRAMMGPAFTTMLGLAREAGTESVSAFLAGSNEAAMSIALGCGMRLVRPMLLMSAKAFGDWTMYLPSDPGLM